MGSYHSSEPSPEGGSGGAPVNNPDRAVQGELGDFETAGDRDLDDFDISDSMKESIEETVVREGVDEEAAGELKNAIAQAAEQGGLSEAAVERLDVTVAHEDSEADSDVGVKVNQNGTVIAGATHHLATDSDGNINSGQARRLVAREELVANGITRSNPEATDQYRAQVEAVDGDGFSEGLEMGSPEEKKIDVSNENLAQGEMVEMAEALNESIDIMHETEQDMAGGRTDAGRQTTDAENLYGVMVDEYTTAQRGAGHNDGFNGGTSTWQYHGETLKAFTENTDYELNEQTKEFINVMNKTGAESDSVEQHWDTDGKVFEDAGANAKRVASNLGSNFSPQTPGGNAKVSRNIIDEIKEVHGVN